MLLACLASLALAQTIEVPTRLRVVRSDAALEVSVDQRGKRKLSISASAGGILGVEQQLSVHPVGEAKGATSTGLSGGTSFDLGTSLFHLVPDGLPVAGVAYLVEVKLTLFETDVPPQHHWAPRAGKFRVLWAGTLTSTSR